MASRRRNRLGTVEGGAGAAIALAAARALYRRARAARELPAAEPEGPPPPGVVSALERAVSAAQRASEQARSRGPAPIADSEHVSERDVLLARAELADALSRRAGTPG